MEKKSSKQLGQVLREIRESKGLTRYAVSLQAGIKPTTLSSIESLTTSTNFETVRKIAAVLGVTIADIDAALPPPVLGDLEAGTRPRGRPKSDSSSNQTDTTSKSDSIAARATKRKKASRQ